MENKKLLECEWERIEFSLLFSFLFSFFNNEKWILKVLFQGLGYDRKRHIWVEVIGFLN